MKYENFSYLTDAEAAIAGANPAQANTGRARAGTVDAQSTVDSGKDTHSQMRTAAGVWAGV